MNWNIESEQLRIRRYVIAGRIIRGLWCSPGDWWALVLCRTNGEATNTEVANGREPNGDSCDDMDQGFLFEKGILSGLGEPWTSSAFVG